MEEGDGRKKGRKEGKGLSPRKKISGAATVSSQIAANYPPRTRAPNNMQQNIKKLKSLSKGKCFQLASECINRMKSTKWWGRIKCGSGKCRSDNAWKVVACRMYVSL